MTEKAIKSTKSPTLTCKITGNTRVTSENYLNDKAARLGKTVQWLKDNYVSKNICSQLRKGIPVSKLTDKTISDADLKNLIKCNSKCSDEFEVVNGVYTPTKSTSKTKTKTWTKSKTTDAPKAPTIVESDDNETLEHVVEILTKVEEPTESSEDVLEELNKFEEAFE